MPGEFDIKEIKLNQFKWIEELKRFSVGFAMRFFAMFQNVPHPSKCPTGITNLAKTNYISIEDNETQDDVA